MSEGREKGHDEARVTEEEGKVNEGSEKIGSGKKMGAGVGGVKNKEVREKKQVRRRRVEVAVIEDTNLLGT